MTETENPHAGQGMAVLDIGDQIGALLVHAHPDLLGAEIEICPSGARTGSPDDGAGWWHGHWRTHHHHEPAWPHVAVLARPTSDGPQPCALFPGLRAGRYDLWLRPAGQTQLTADIHGGQVTTLTWPDDN